MVTHSEIKDIEYMSLICIEMLFWMDIMLHGSASLSQCSVLGEMCLFPPIYF